MRGAAKRFGSLQPSIYGGALSSTLCRSAALLPNPRPQLLIVNTQPFPLRRRRCRRRLGRGWRNRLLRDGAPPGLGHEANIDAAHQVTQGIQGVIVFSDRLLGVFLLRVVTVESGFGEQIGTAACYHEQR